MTHEKNILISAQELYLAVCKKIKGGHDSIDAFKGYFEALDLLYSEPKLGDFVPTNEKGEVMEEPLIPGNSVVEEISIEKYPERLKAYQSALDRRLWEGWEVGNRQADINGEGFYLKYEGNDVFAFWTIDNQEFELAMGGGYNIMETYNELITSGVKLERIQRK